ncbi:MAG: nucleotidyltransferase, partial [Thermoanaerobaculales bacterium]|nr:nucleotidyltransferase [Thermoanaerobaculales bacterium]
MMAATRRNIAAILSQVAHSLDISPTDYDRAVRSYGAVGKWLEDGYENGAYPESSNIPSIYPQGSISLGTIVRPIKDGYESDFDVDLVCELQSSATAMSSEATKAEVGERLKGNDTYRKKLDSEGKRCWTLTYAESEGIGFHMDVLPCIPSPSEDHPDYPGAISITNKDKTTGTYVWKPGSPKGYGQWFRDQNVTFGKMTRQQKQHLFEQSRSHQPGMVKYASIDDVPDQLVRTPLQRAI